MGHDHFKTICTNCRKVINQCRCMDENKTVLYELCENCMEKSPVEDTVWMRCFFEVFEKCSKADESQVQFSEVDELVLEKSKLTVKDFAKWLGFE